MMSIGFIIHTKTIHHDQKQHNMDANFLETKANMKVPFYISNEVSGVIAGYTFTHTSATYGTETLTGKNLYDTSSPITIRSGSGDNDYWAGTIVMFFGSGAYSFTMPRKACQMQSSKDTSVTIRIQSYGDLFYQYMVVIDMASGACTQKLTG